LDIRSKTQGEKTKTQVQKTKNSILGFPKTQYSGKFFIKSEEFDQNTNILSKSCKFLQKLKNLSKTQGQTNSIFRQIRYPLFAEKSSNKKA